MKKLVKILPILMVVIMILMICSTVSANSFGIDDIKIDTGVANESGLSGVSSSILGIIQVVGTIVAVGVLMVIGIKYMMGSAEEKAEYKKTMIPYLVGAVILFAAVNIAGVVVSMANKITTTTETSSIVEMTDIEVA